MHAWLLIPGGVLFGAGFLLQFGSLLSRPRDMDRVLLGVKLRFIGFGVLLIGIGVNIGIRALFAGPNPVMLAISLFLVAMAGAWFYAATDRIFSQRNRQ